MVNDETIINLVERMKTQEDYFRDFSREMREKIEEITNKIHKSEMVAVGIDGKLSQIIESQLKHERYHEKIEEDEAKRKMSDRWKIRETVISLCAICLTILTIVLGSITNKQMYELEKMKIEYAESKAMEIMEQ